MRKLLSVYSFCFVSSRLCQTITGHHRSQSRFADTKEYDSEGFRISIQPKKEFYDEEKKYCKLCRENVPDYRQHSMFHVYHTACVQLVQSVMNMHHQIPSMSLRDIVNSWWPKLRDHRAFFRITKLSAESQAQRKKKLKDLLLFLKRNGVIKHTFSCLVQQGGTSYVPHRTMEFDRLEWIGDNIIKTLFFDRCEVICSNTKTSFHWFLSFVMGNEPLHDAYDAFSFDQIIMDGLNSTARVILPVSKMKADIVEALLGELQVIIWNTQSDVSNDYMIYSQHDISNYPIHHLVFHALHETVTVIIMEILLKLVRRSWPFIEKLKKRQTTQLWLAAHQQCYMHSSKSGLHIPAAKGYDLTAQPSPLKRQSRCSVKFPIFHMCDAESLYRNFSVGGPQLAELKYANDEIKSGNLTFLNKRNKAVFQHISRPLEKPQISLISHEKVKNEKTYPLLLHRACLRAHANVTSETYAKSIVYSVEKISEFDQHSLSPYRFQSHWSRPIRLQQFRMGIINRRDRPVNSNAWETICPALSQWPKISVKQTDAEFFDIRRCYDVMLV